MGIASPRVYESGLVKNSLLQCPSAADFHTKGWSHKYHRTKEEFEKSLVEEREKKDESL